MVKHYIDSEVDMIKELTDEALELTESFKKNLKLSEVLTDLSEVEDEVEQIRYLISDVKDIEVTLQQLTSIMKRLITKHMEFGGTLSPFSNGNAHEF